LVDSVPIEVAEVELASVVRFTGLPDRLDEALECDAAEADVLFGGFLELAAVAADRVLDEVVQAWRDDDQAAFVVVAGGEHGLGQAVLAEELLEGAGAQRRACGLDEEAGGGGDLVIAGAEGRRRLCIDSAYLTSRATKPVRVFGKS
jgi:hypothetical protein